MKKPPCKDCQDRTIEPNCHDTCERYKSWKEDNNAEKQRRKEMNTYTIYNHEKTERMYRKNGWKREGQR